MPWLGQTLDRFVPTPLTDSAHELIQLADLLVYKKHVSEKHSLVSTGLQLTTHFVDLCLIHFFASPGVAFNLLSVHLPLCEEANLFFVSLGPEKLLSNS